MDYFSKFLRANTHPTPKAEVDHAAEFHKSWVLIKNTLMQPDERQITRGIKSTDVPARLQSMVDSLVWESTRTEEGVTGACLEYLLKNDVLGTLVKLSESDRPFGIQAEVLRAVQNMVVLLDEQFLVHTAVHKAVLRLLRNCVGDDLQEQLDGHNKPMGAAGIASRSQPSEYEEDLVNLLCILCSRIRTYRELLMIFFHDKQWYRPEPLFSVEEGEEDEDEEDERSTLAENTGKQPPVDPSTPPPQSSPSPSQQTEISAMGSSITKKPEYEFLLFNYLLRFVHREGQIGDFARAGLLFLMDVAMSPLDPSPHKLVEEDLSSSISTARSGPDHDPNTDAALALAEYILDGDFSDVLAAGLAAVYSLLPTKLEVKPPLAADAAAGSAMILGSSTLTDSTPEERDKLESERERSRAMGLEESSSPDFKGRLDHFLKLLEFLQDVFRRNKTRETEDGSLDPSSFVGSAIVQSILDAVRSVFLENILYPSILECSDADGSSVAVMSYIEIMIRTLENGQLADLLVDFLMSEDNTEDLSSSRPRPRSMLNLGGKLPPSNMSQAELTEKAKRRRRQSTAMKLLDMEAPNARRQSSYFTSMGRFTLKDLLLTSLRSKSPATATAALQLLQSLLLQYCTLCSERVLVVIHDPQATTFPQPSILPEALEDMAPPPKPTDDSDDDEAFVYPSTNDSATEPVRLKSVVIFSQPDTTYWTHEREMGLYLQLVSRVDPDHAEDAFSTGYDHYLRDAIVSIEAQSCFRADFDPAERAKLKHCLNPNDPVLSLVLGFLRKFFSNTPETNMALTGVLATLALCPDRSLAGWLTFASKKSPTPSNAREDEFAPYEDDGDDRSIDFRIEEKLASEHALPASSMDEQSRPVVYAVFHGLVGQLERYRQMVGRFDEFLQERRQGLLFNENLTDALTLALDFDASPKQSGFAGALQQVQQVLSPNESAQRPKPKSKPTAGQAIVSFLTPKKNKPSRAPSEPTTPSRSARVEASPFGPHYQRTGSIVVEPFLAPAPSSGPWTPAKARKFNVDEEDVFGSSGQWGESEAQTGSSRVVDESDEDDMPKVAHVTLSRLLDNVVILEESVKELVAIIHARRSLGIDSIRYL
ncbi:Retinoic acid induced 16-like protein-domain-containing protein [Epithele typhae]|uniref:Retinoic acid induced 16-like protein-domain-containing protein n=1 Tax=Epithele typhae TaxID=378194 RepID=UPI002007984E|nr:Retinoic acid induced 16-like protein-domain-containing protein [Epithele typhae]KAH9946164.1 Retinoic acid induced 16-like protein-domain-containing protein [Epithele typhae]